MIPFGPLERWHTVACYGGYLGTVYRVIDRVDGDHFVTCTGAHNFCTWEAASACARNLNRGSR